MPHLRYDPCVYIVHDHYFGQCSNRGEHRCTPLFFYKYFSVPFQIYTLPYDTVHNRIEKPATFPAHQRFLFTVILPVRAVIMVSRSIYFRFVITCTGSPPSQTRHYAFLQAPAVNFIFKKTYRLTSQQSPLLNYRPQK